MQDYLNSAKALRQEADRLCLEADKLDRQHREEVKAEEKAHEVAKKAKTEAEEKARAAELQAQIALEAQVWENCVASLKPGQKIRLLDGDIVTTPDTPTPIKLPLGPGGLYTCYQPSHVQSNNSRPLCQLYSDPGDAQLPEGLCWQCPQGRPGDTRYTPAAY